MKSLLKEVGLPKRSLVLSDASAALGIIQRQGLGKTRHIDCSYLFVQNLNAEKVLRFAKVPGADNPADLCTKGLAKDSLQKHVKAAKGKFADGRPKLCAEI